MLYTVALTIIPGISATMQLDLIRHCSSAEDIVMRPDETLKSTNMSYRYKVINAINTHRSSALAKAQEELAFCQHHGIQVLPITSPDYPTRLMECSDAPVVLYYRGKANLNTRHVLAVVGTRKITEYGKQVCARFTERLAQLLPDTLVISGLAYGADIHTHRGCLEHGLPTVGVVAHGLDQIYPATHRNDAQKMVTGNGGILTEYVRGVRPLQGNFLRRNRIVAGMADATIVVESAEHGGSLVTARIAYSYDRDVYAFPGRINDTYSVGCNQLIQNLKATMILSADDVVRDLGWWEESTAAQAQSQQLSLFDDANFGAPQQSQLLPNMPADQLRLAQALQGTDGLTAASLASQTGLPVAEVSNLLFDMEMDGIVKVLPGGFYLLTK